jgi:hypothetical protein
VVQLVNNPLLILFLQKSPSVKAFDDLTVKCHISKYISMAYLEEYEYSEKKKLKLHFQSLNYSSNILVPEFSRMMLVRI